MPLLGDDCAVNSWFMDIGARVLSSVPSDRRAMIGIDGVDGSGKSSFAAALAQCFPGRQVIVVHLDEFLNPAATRHRQGKSSPEGFWLDTYNYDAFTRDVIRPLRVGGNGLYRNSSYDSQSDAIVQPALMEADDQALIIVEGMFLHRPKLAEEWDFSLFLDVPFGETARRMASRDGSHPDPEHASMHRYVGGQRLYFDACQPWNLATIVVDNRAPDRPRIILASEASAAG